MRAAISLLFLISSLVSIVLASANYYDILGVSKDADEKEIKRAYRELSKKYHPDKNTEDDDAQAKYMDITNAYEVLMDSEKRNIYDRYGEEGLKNGAGQHGGGGGGHGGDPFRDFFGGGGGFQRGPPKAQDVQAETKVTLADYYNGKDIDFQIDLMDVCDVCKGTGSSDGKKHQCSDCGGRGRIVQKMNLGHGMIQQIETACRRCGGSGQQIKNKCKTCHGQGSYVQTKNMNVHLPAGAPRGHVEVFEGKGQAQPGIIPGDLKLHITESSDNNLGYRRSGNNLYRTEVLSLKEALLGDWERTLPFFDVYDPKITIQREAYQSVQNGEVEVIKGKGMPVLHGNDEFGDLFIEYLVIYPVGNQKKLKELHDEL
mgnify:CR=1 FL=1|jgi:DnaJ-related protein SCJ1